MSALVETIPHREDLEQILCDLEPNLDPNDAIFKAGVVLLAEGFAAASPPPWLLDGMLDCVCFKAHLGFSLGFLRVVEDEA